MHTHELTERQEATILAALRLWQQDLDDRGIDAQQPDLVDIATDGGQHKHLTSEEIDELCEAINEVQAF